MSDLISFITHNTGAQVAAAALIARGAIDVAILTSEVLRSLIRDLRAAYSREREEWKSTLRGG
jgi:hypothetical protein